MVNPYRGLTVSRRKLFRILLLSNNPGTAADTAHSLNLINSVGFRDHQYKMYLLLLGRIYYKCHFLALMPRGNIVRWQHEITVYTDLLPIPESTWCDAFKCWTNHGAWTRELNLVAGSHFQPAMTITVDLRAALTDIHLRRTLFDISRAVVRSKRIVVVTGAGISCSCGIPVWNRPFQHILNTIADDILFRTLDPLMAYMRL